MESWSAREETRVQICDSDAEESLDYRDGEVGCVPRKLSED